MSDETAEAKERARIAGEQAKHAGRNAGRAVKAGAEAAADTVAEEVRDAADRVESAAEAATETILDKVTGDLSVGILAAGVSIYSGLVAIGKLRKVTRS